MHNSKHINLDLSKLYGYKIVEAEGKKQSISSKIGEKGPGPDPTIAPATVLQAKIGLGKGGNN